MKKDLLMSKNNVKHGGLFQMICHDLFLLIKDQQLLYTP